MLRGISDAVGAAGLAAVAPPPLAFLLSTLELLLPLHTALAKSKTPPLGSARARRLRLLRARLVGSGRLETP